MSVKVKFASTLGSILLVGALVFASRLVAAPVLASTPAQTPVPASSTSPSTSSSLSPFAWATEAPAEVQGHFPEIWRRANQASSYRFDATIEQTYIPRAQAGMIGQQDQTVNLYLQGDVQRKPAARSRITLRAEGPVGNSQSVTLVEENGRSFIQQADKLVPTQGNGDLAAVSPVAPGNFLDYLAAAQNVQAVVPPGIETDAAAVRHYTFEVDNDRLYQLMLDRAVQANQPRPAMPPALRNMVASGEVWVGEDGLPRRQIITIRLPRASTSYDARVRMVLDLSNYGGVPALPPLVPAGGGNYRIDPGINPASPPNSASGLPLGSFDAATTNAVTTAVISRETLNALLLIMAFGGLALLVIIWYRRNRKAAYRAIVLGLVTYFVAGSPLNAAQASVQRAQAEQSPSLAEALGFAESPQAVQAQAEVDKVLSEGFSKIASSVRASNHRNAPDAPDAPDQPSEPNLPFGPSSANTAAEVNPTVKCGDFTPGVDTDGEGLTDQQEACLGTSPTNYDTDKDGVTDAQEVLGFTCGNKAWTSDPLNPDSNGDGVADGRQYPNTLVETGVANCDTDGDGVPDVWDTDNDNDGMPNKFDLSPVSKSTYTNALKLQINPQGYTGTLYVELQLQPEISSHIRYATTPLDWPNDDSKGQITDLDNSKDDLRLIPMLEIETNAASAALAEKYGYSVRTITQPVTTTLMYVPLRPQSDGGGLNKVFYTKIPYTSAELTSTAAISWNARMVWMVQAKVDEYIDSCTANNPGKLAAGTCTSTQNSLVHVYRNESFRISGMNVVKSEGFETAVFGTPQTPVEDRNLFQVMEGLSASLLDFQRFLGQTPGRTPIQEFAARFNTPGTSLDLRFQLPETVTVPVSTTLQPHQDAGIAATGELVNRYLSRYFASPSVINTCADSTSGPRFACATLGFLTEQSVGSIGLDDLTRNSDGTYVVALSNINVLKQRSLKAVLYEQLASGEWSPVSTAHTLALINRRYGPILDLRAAEYSQFDPAITRDGLMLGVFMQYLVWAEGFNRAVEFDQTQLLSVEPTSAQAQTTLNSLVASRKSKDVVDQVKSIGAVMGAATSPTTPGGVIGAAVKKVGSAFESTSNARPIKILVPSTSGGSLTWSSKTIFTIPAIEKFGAKALIAGSSVVLAASIALAIAQSVCADPAKECDEGKIETATKTIGSFEAITGAISVVAAFGGLQKTQGGLKGLKAGLLDSVGDGFGKAGAVFAVLGTGLAIGTAWAEFGLLSSSGAIQPGSPAYKLALAKAIGTTIWAIILLVLSFIPFGIGDLISAILGLIDTLISLISGGELDLATVVVRFFYDIKVLTELRDQTFIDLGTGWKDANLGLIAGNTFVATNLFSATLGYTSDGKASDVTTSNTFAEGYFIATGTNLSDTTAVTSNTVKTARQCPVANGVMTCTNQLGAEFKLLKPGINTELSFANFFSFQYYYKECIFACGITTKNDTDLTTQPSAAADIDKVTQKVTIDVLPASLDGLWSWALLRNPDRDGDGLSDADEAKNQTNPANPDTDGDGLSDGFEASTTHTDPRLPDTDGDGLSDSLENQLGTSPKLADSDNDGLSDGDEVFHALPNGNWVGGWTTTLPGGLQVRVYSDPLSGDADDDALSDRNERALAISPNAFNKAPRLYLTAQPILVEPGSLPGVFVAPGQRVTYTLYLSTGYSPVTTTLSVCLPSLVTNQTLGTQYGNRTFTPQTGACNGTNKRYDFNFAGTNTLQIGEYISTTVTGVASASATTSQRSTASASITVAGQVLSDTLTFVLDADKPGQAGAGTNASTDASTNSAPAADFAPQSVQSPDTPDNLDASAAADSLNSAEALALVNANPLPGILFSAPADGAILKRASGGTTYIVGGYANDATTWIDRVEIDTGTGGGYVAATDTSPWSYAWQLPADGNYTLSARALDAVNNISAITTTRVLVDGTAPTATLSVPGNGYVKPAANSTIQLSGTASDNLAGLSLIQISINNGTWTTLLAVPETQQRLTANWTYTWTLPQSADASGTYVMKVRAIDRAGNESLPTTSKLVVDGLPPTDDLTTNAYFGIPDVLANQPLSLRGRANDLGNVPLPSRPTNLAGSVSTILSATTWLQYGSVADDNAGVQIAWLGDVNGDGRADLGVGMPASGNGAGRVAIVYGRGGNWPVPPNAEALFDSPSSFVGAPAAGLGAQIASAGDVNGDNFYDVVIGDPANNRAFLIFGRGSSLGSSLALTGSAPTAQWNVLDVAGLGTLTGIASAGDVNGDSFGDLLISAGGKAYLLLGHAGAWYASTSVANDAAATLPLPANATATGVGDVDKNGFADFVATGANAVYLFSGNATFAAGAKQALQVPGNAVATLASLDANVRVAPLGDVNGDGMSDFIYSSGNAPRLVLGRQGGAWNFSREFSGYAAAPSGFLAAPGDVNADGLNDIILGVPGNNSAYLFLGAASLPTSLPIQATFTGVAAVASAPYSAGADLNCDISADLLMVSTQTIPAQVPLNVKGTSLLGADSLVSQSSLPVAPSVNTATVNAPGVRYVDDDYCFSCGNDGHTFNTNAFDSIANALINVPQGTQIVVKPGVYGPFTMTVLGVSIIGEDADTVIVDGQGGASAIALNNTENIHLSNLTVRNAAQLLRLTNAGQNQGVPGLNNSIYLDRLVMHTFTTNAIYLNNASSVDVQRSTIVGDAANGPHIFMDRSAADTYFPTPSWAARTNLPANINTGSLLVSTRNGSAPLNLFALMATSPITFQGYDPTSNQWYPLPLPASVTSVKGMAGGLFVRAVMGDVSSNNLGYQYNPATNSWVTCSNAPFTPGTGFAMSEGSTNQSSYVLAGGGTAFYDFNCGTGWTSLAPIPLAPGTGAVLLTDRSTGLVYALVGGNRPNFYRYNRTANGWTAMPNAPFNANDGAGMAYSSGIWAAAGGTTSSVGYFNTDQALWISLPIAAPPAAIGAGGGMVALGSATSGLPLYVMRGGNTNSFYTFGPAGFIGQYPPIKVRLTSTALVGPSTPQAINWINVSRPQFDFDYAIDGLSQFVNGGTISPSVPATQVISFASANFFDPTNRVYRLEQGSVLTAGYQAVRGDVYVSALYCPTCTNDGRTWNVDAFSSVQAGINSGAIRVRVLPGVYQEKLALAGGVQVIGSGAEATILKAPTNLVPACLPIYACNIGQYLNTIPFITADGIKTASLSRVSVVGLGLGDKASGLRASNGTVIKVSRNIFRNTANGILLDGSTTDAEIVNNTFAQNANGIVGIRNAGLDVRNNSFSNGTFGIAYDAAAVQVLRQYNNYFSLNFPLVTFPGGVAVTPNGPGELTTDPFFINPDNNDYRLLSNSPLIDAGNPSDPTPPNAGRVDIGYSESGQAAFYASTTYCAQCATDGLVWQVDAFNTIQGALNAAAAYLRGIGCIKPADDSNPLAPASEKGLCEARVVVGVAAGTYNERVSVPSYVSLAGVGADSTTINAQGITVPVTFNGVVHAQVSGFNLIGAAVGAPNAGVRVLGASNNITVTRNKIVSASAGIRFEGGASGAASFNTVQAGTDSVLASGADSWATAGNNILTGPSGNSLRAELGGSLISSYNLLFNPTPYSSVAAGVGDSNQNPLFVSGSDFTLQATSPAVDAADPGLPASVIPVGGGSRADLGYKELVATPLALLFGKLGTAPCYVGNSGVQTVEVGVASVPNLNQPVTATLPAQWTQALLDTPGETASFWNTQIVPAPGLYRLYTRATDMLGNQETPTFDYFNSTLNLYSGGYYADGNVPTVVLVSPQNGFNGITAALVLTGTASDYAGTRFTVDTPYFEATVAGVTTRIAGGWVKDSWNGTGPRTFRGVVALPPGTYSVVAKARDLAGNVGSSSVANITLNAPGAGNHVIAFLAPQNGSWTNQATLRVNGSALFSSVSGAGWVSVQVNGGTAFSATMADPAAQISGWLADVPLIVGSNTIAARALNSAGAGVTATLIVQRDVTAPTLVAPGNGYFTRTATLAGTATDAQSGVEAVEVSVDGGYHWMPATVSGANWSVTWTAAPGNQNTSYPASVRAKDRAGNIVTQTFGLIVDDLSPSDFGNVQFSIAPGTRLTSVQSLVMTWTTPIDNSGLVTTFANINQISVTAGTAQVGGNSLSAALNLDGAWYAHLTARDRAGNYVNNNFGPWYVSTGQFCLNPQQPIVIDGDIQLDRNEWPPSSFLDDDERPGFDGSPVKRDRQSLYTIWDANAFYIGWRGGWWSVDGALFVYLSTGGAGTTQLISSTTSSNVLPFAADVAVAITDRNQGRWYRFTGGAWQPQAGLSFVQSDLGDTEIRVPVAASSLNEVRLLAVALSDAGQPWSLFPATNPLAGTWFDSYRWQPICSVTSPNAGQPRGVSVLTQLTSQPDTGALLPPSGVLTYVVALDNRESRPIANTVFTLTASAGLSYQTAAASTGITCESCTPGAGQWRIAVPSLAAGATAQVTVTAQLAANLAATPRITTTLTARGPGVSLNGAALTHLTDGLPPTLTVLLASPLALPVGPAILEGFAEDQGGIGVASVEVRPTGSGTWQVVSGTATWLAELNVPAAPNFSVDVRATDRFGQSSPVQTFSFVVDNVAPALNMSLPAAVSGTLATIGGNVSDPVPVGRVVRFVDVQIDDPSDAITPTDWIAASVALTGTPGVGLLQADAAVQAEATLQQWRFGWLLPDADGRNYLVRAQATDDAGNVKTTSWQPTLVDSRPPLITVTTALPGVVGQPTSAPLGGLVTDGGGVSGMRMLVYAPDGSASAEAVSRNGTSWSWMPQKALTVGTYQLRVEATDVAGNTQQAGPFVLKVTGSANSLVITPSLTAGNAPYAVSQWTSQTVVIHFTCSDPMFGVATCPADQVFTAEGVFTVTAIATNTAGLTTTVVVGPIQIDKTAPDTALSGQPSDPSREPFAQFGFTGVDALSGIGRFECQIDNGNFGACSSPKVYAGLSLGVHSFAVRAVDRAGNADPTPATLTWHVEAATQLLYLPTVMRLP